MNFCRNIVIREYHLADVKLQCNESLHEPMIRENGPEEVETLLQSVLANVLLQHLVVLADGCQEHDQEDVLETVDPLPPVAPLATHVDLGIELKKS